MSTDKKAMASLKFDELRHRIGRRFDDVSFKTYDIYDEHQREIFDMLVQYCDRLDTHVPDGVNVLLLGPCGTGKDHLAMSIARDAASQGFTTVWTDGESLYSELRDSMDSESTSEQEIIRKYVQCDILWISDPAPTVPLGSRSMGAITDYQARMLYQIIDIRYRKMRPVVMTANSTNVSQFQDLIGHRTCDRIAHNGVVLTCGWESYRRRESL